MRALRLLAALVGVLLLLTGAVAGIANRELVDSDQFVDNVETARADPDVVEALATLLTERLVDAEPDLVAVRPLIKQTARTSIASDTAGRLLRAALLPLQRAVLDGRDVATVDLTDLAASVVGALGTQVPQAVLARVPSEVDVPVGAVLGDDTIRYLSLLRQTDWVAWVAPLLGLAALAGAGALGRPGRRVRGAVSAVGAGLALTGLLLAAVALLVDAYVDRADSARLDGAVAHALWAHLARTLWTVPLVALVVGLALFVVARPRTVRGRWGRGVATLSVLAVLSLVVANGWPADHRPDNVYAVDPAACNGHRELCDRRYDQVTYPATHNSMAAANEPGWYLPEQPDGIIDQLDHGIRTLLIDSWYAQATERPGVVAQPLGSRARASAEAEQSFGEGAVRRVLEARDALGLRPRGPARPYLCHGNCELGSTRWVPLMKQVRTWLADHPREVVTMIVQDEVSPADTAAVFRSAGLLRYVYVPEGGPGQAWPTLGQMVESGKRLVVLMEKHGGGTTRPWLLDGFSWIQDTPFTFRDPAALAAPASCARNRGPAAAPLFLLNHWVSDLRRVSAATAANADDVLQARARRCSEARGRTPTYVAVDFYDRGDLFAVVDALNGLD